MAYSPTRGSRLIEATVGRPSGDPPTSVRRRYFGVLTAEVSPRGTNLPPSVKNQGDRETGPLRLSGQAPRREAISATSATSVRRRIFRAAVAVAAMAARVASE